MYFMGECQPHVFYGGVPATCILWGSASHMYFMGECQPHVFYEKMYATCVCEE